MSAQRAAAARFGRQHILAAATAAVVVLGLGFQMWRQTVVPARELAGIQQEIKALELSVKQAEQVTAKAAAVESWLATDVTWLDGLNTLSQRLRPMPLAEKDFPVADDLVVTQLTFSRLTGNDLAVGRIDLLALAKSDSAVAALEKRLRDEQHQVSTGKLGRDKTVPGYESSFSLQVGLLSSPAQKSPTKEVKP